MKHMMTVCVFSKSLFFFKESKVDIRYCFSFLLTELL